MDDMDENAYVPGFSDELRGLEKKLQKAIRTFCRQTGQTPMHKAKGGWKPLQRKDAPYQVVARPRTVAVATGGATPLDEELGDNQDDDGEFKPTASSTASEPYAVR